jgi:hypothetical protein
VLIEAPATPPEIAKLMGVKSGGTSGSDQLGRSWIEPTALASHAGSVGKLSEKPIKPADCHARE